ncbi:mucin-2 [Episyrphus balteatus]|uniref:mucin-2 n=1 Tax=Episyrphus balteatus TaxID=286459 RepID=UPI00248555C6|nr:mucin-2 [Episyrphus balteatus]
MISGHVAGLRIMQHHQILAFIALLVLPFGLPQQTVGPYIVEPTPALRLGDEELTTVLLVSNDNRTASQHGRYLNVRPNVGLLTSTARTFIQEGVTTEYATQVLGTTLENGRIYAQLLKKSSRVLYDKESLIAPSAINSNNGGGAVHTSIIGEEPAAHIYAKPRSLLQSHNDLVADKDWQDIDDRIILEKNSLFVGNTDFVGSVPKQRSSFIVFPEKTADDQNEQKLEAPFNVNKPPIGGDNVKPTDSDDAVRIMANKVQPAVDLPTYTIKNMFSPSGFSWESSPETETDTETENKNEKNIEKSFSKTTSPFAVQRSPKLLYHQVMKDDYNSRSLSTVTYYGFADFTTIVGDSVIVFSPSTSAADKQPSAQVTSIKGKATLGPQEPSYVLKVPITITQDLIEPTFVIPMLSTDVNDLRIMPTDMREKNKEEEKEEEQEQYVNKPLLENDVETMLNRENIETTTKSLQQQDVLVTFEDPSFYDEMKDIEEQQQPTTLSPENDNENETNQLTTLPPTSETEDDQTTELDLNQFEHTLVSSMSDTSSSMAENSISIPTPTETTSRVMLSRPSDEEIFKIYSSLAKAEAERAASKASQVSESVSVKSLETTTTESSPPPVSIESNEKPSPKTPPITTTPEEEEQIQPDIPVEGGATTVFFEDDPFLEFVSPSATETNVVQQTTTTSFEQSPESEHSISTAAVPEQPATEPSTEKEEEEVTVLSSTNSDIEKETNPQEEEFKPIIKEIQEDEEVENCVRTSQVYLTQIPKTVTFYTTFFIPNDDNSETSTSIETNAVPSFDIAQATKHYCIQPTPGYVTLQKSTSVPVLERPLEISSSSNTQDSQENINAVLQATTPMMIVRENAEVTEASAASGDGYEDGTEKNEEEEEEDDEEDETESDSDSNGDQESGEEIELIYKTLYTTYTYLTTFFHDSTTSISSHKEIVTNVITSSMSSHETISSTEDGGDEIEPTATKSPIINHATSTFDLQSSDLIKIDGILREDSDDQPTKLTEQLDDSKIAKTYFTTYTYYTTIFVDGETEIMSRTEVHTNIVGKSSESEPVAAVSPSARYLQIDDAVSDEDNAVIELQPTATYETIQRTVLFSKEESIRPKNDHGGVQELESSSSSSSSKSEKKVVPIIDVSKLSSSGSNGSNGQNQIVELNGVLEDQISSESNTEEIIPSATLLLQTSFTTFTYYTTMYSNEATNVVSRLETITNVVTETLQPTKTLSVDEATVPITYFTTFTYWTKLAKEGEITTLSREETISNVVTPSVSAEMTVTDSSLPSESISTVEPVVSASSSSSSELSSKDIEPTTFYTTYTYYTTSYVGDQTVTDSRFETVTNVLMPTITASLDLNTATLPLEEMEKNETSSKVTDDQSMNPPRTISYDFKTIVDAEGISTLYFKTQVVATVVDGTSTEISSSTSTINIDESKKTLSIAALPESSESSSTRSYKTGLVRLISGTKLSNQTTTVYQSKVIGTIIDQRYAQIIESTSSFIIDKTPAPGLGIGIEASSTQNLISVKPTVLVPALAVEKTLESSISDAQENQNNQNNEGGDEGEDESENENGEENEDDDESGRPRTRLSFQTKKKTFTPVIRPFVSRNRPQFAPKRKNILQSSATIITRSDLTPTITATPAIKSDGRGRFSSSRKSNVGGFSSPGAISGSSSQGGKRFGRPSKSSQFGGAFGSSSSYPGSSSRNRLQSSRGVQQGLSSNYNAGGGFPNSRRSGGAGSFRGSSTSARSFSSAYPGNSRLRIRPSSSLSYDSLSSTASYTTLPTDSAEDEGGITQRYESEEEADFTTENLRRNNNNLLRFRRPQLNRPAFQGGGAVQRNSATSGQVTPRRIPLSQKPRTTTTTSTTTTTQRSRPRVSPRPSTLGQIQNRSRPQNSLFPPRRLFPAQNAYQAATADEIQKPGTGDDFDNEKEDEDSDYENDEEGIENEEQDDVSRRRRSEISSLKSLVKKRSKRQANNFRNRFRRPTSTKPTSEERSEDTTEDESSTVRSRASSRFTPRTHSPAHTPSSPHSSGNKAAQQHNNRAIRPTKPNSSNRAQFTLREKDTTPKHSTPRLSTNFRRPVPNGGTSSSSASSRRTTTAASRSKTSSRIKNYGNNPSTETTHSSLPRGRTPASGRSRSTARSRSRSDFTTDPIVPAFDGTITVTHTTPTEITIPIVNGKVTEYKNVLTTTSSTEVVPPNQYTSIIGPLGSSTLVLNREETSINLNGATEVTQFILHEQPTTTVIFTPTTIRGRKTSFAHMIPSTAYQVENVVSTMQPQIAANAPLANILLSQLLLGNLGGLNQPNINPLLALGAGQATQANSQVPGVPTTEYKTRSSTYVTTVTNGMSTIIPLTFHGKEILTTIYDSSSDVITATEYFTETIVITPTQQAQQVQQVNSLLLPYLLQQQLQGQNQQQLQLPSQPALPIQNSIPPQLLFPDNLQDLDHNGIQKYNDYGSDIEDYPNNTQDDQIIESNTNTNTNNHSNQRSGSRKKGGRKFHKQQQASAAPPPAVESSVITLYVSGRRPGEFSTVLSTVQIGAEPSLRKRQINRVQPLFRSTSPHVDDFEDYYSSDGSEIEEYLLPASNDIISSHSLKSNSLSEETQSLESIVGDVSLWYTKTSALFINNSNNGGEPSTIYEDLLAQSSSSSDTNLQFSSLSSSSEIALDSSGETTNQSKHFLV